MIARPAPRRSRVLTATGAARYLAGIAVAAALSLGIGSARATPIALDQWYTFGFGNTGSPLVTGTGFITGQLSLLAPDAPWEFMLAGTGTLVVTDGFASGDRFELFDNLASLGLTSAPTSGDNCSNNELACLANANMSSGSFLLAAGSHSITGAVTVSPFNEGAGFFIVQSAQAVAEPATLALFGIGLAGLGFARRRRRG